MSAGSSPIRQTEVPVGAGQVIDREDWRYIPAGTTVEVVSVRGNKRHGTFQGVRDDRIVVLAEVGKTSASHLLQDQLQSVTVFGNILIPGPGGESGRGTVAAALEGAKTVPLSDALPGTSLSLEDLKELPLGSRLELTSIRGNPRTGIFRGLTTDQDIHFVPDSDEFAAVYPKSRLSSIRLLANGPEQVQFQAEILAALRSEFQKASLAFASHTDEMRGAIVVDAQTGRIIEILTKRSIEFDTLTWDEDGLLRSEHAEFTIRINMNTGTFDIRTSAANPPSPQANATVRQCVADFVRELVRSTGRNSTGHGTAT